MVCKCTHTSVVESYSPPLTGLSGELIISCRVWLLCVNVPTAKHVLNAFLSTVSQAILHLWCLTIFSSARTALTFYVRYRPSLKAAVLSVLISSITSRPFSWQVVSRDTATLAIADISPLYSVHCTSLWQMCYFRCLPSDKHSTVCFHIMPLAWTAAFWSIFIAFEPCL